MAHYDVTLVAASLTFALFIFNCWLKDGPSEGRFAGFSKITQMPWLRFIFLMDGWTLPDVCHTYFKANEQFLIVNFPFSDSRIRASICLTINGPGNLSGPLIFYCVIDHVCSVFFHVIAAIRENYLIDVNW